jgi:hypothetical protein
VDRDEGFFGLIWLTGICQILSNAMWAKAPVAFFGQLKFHINVD